MYMNINYELCIIKLQYYPKEFKFSEVIILISNLFTVCMILFPLESGPGFDFELAEISYSKMSNQLNQYVMEMRELLVSLAVHSQY